MRYDIHFRHGGQITVESKRTLDEISDFFASESCDVWRMLADGDDPAALVSIIDVIAIVPALTPARTPARVKDADGDLWEEIEPGSGNYSHLSQYDTYTLDEIEKAFGLIEILTS